MKINDESRFPHPVLSGFTGDYSKGDFSFVIQEIEEIWEKGLVEIHFKFTIAEESILDLVNCGKANIGLFVTCLETYHNKFEKIDLEQTSISFTGGVLHGSVRVRPLIWTDKKVDGFSSENLHKDFASEHLSFAQGTIIALGEEVTFSAGRQKFAKMETIFTLAKNNEVPPGQVMIQTEEDKISIQAAPTTYASIHKLRNTNPGRVLLLNSIYLPAVMDVLNSLQTPSTGDQDKRWYRTFNSKCEHLGIDPASGKVLEDAQKLLKSPFTKIENSTEFIPND